jgi:hypothetical protein
MAMRFKAEQTFDDPDTGSVYCEGLKYVVRDGNEALAKKVSTWVGKGKVSLVPMSDVAQIQGTGEIKS